MSEKRRITLYLPSGFPEQIDELMEILQAEGVDLKDEKRGIPSVSRLFRLLVSEKLRQKSEVDTVPDHLTSADRMDAQRLTA